MSESARYRGRGVFVAAAIVLVNFVVALQLTGLSYGRYEWSALIVSYASPTATATATPTPQPDGAACTLPSECASTFCVDGVCCNQRCDQPAQQCNAAGQEGTCVPITAPAPALGGEWLVVAAVLLIAVGGLALRWRRAH